MKSTWTAIAYRSPRTDSKWTITGATQAQSKEIIDSYIKKEKAGLIWLAHRRVGLKGMNYFELVFKHRRQVLRGVSKRPTPGFTGEEQSQGGRDQPSAPGKEALGRFLLATKPDLAAINRNIAF